MDLSLLSYFKSSKGVKVVKNTQTPKQTPKTNKLVMFVIIDL